MLQDIHNVASRLARPETRATEAAHIACEAGAEAFLILLRDEEIGALTPAPGFPQTLPGGPFWRAFLKAQHAPGDSFKLQLPFPDQDTLRHAECFACGSAVFLLIGGPSGLVVERFADTPLLPALLKAEAGQLASKSSIRATREATERATNLASALDRARAEIGDKATKLSAALLQADTANRELSQLNQTLEQRVEDEICGRMQVEEALRQSQKMEAIGQLTGGIAHDFNNLLTVILGSADILRKQELPEEKRAKYINAIGDTAERAAKLTSQLLAFARRQSLDPEIFDVVQRVRIFTEMLIPVMGSRIQVEVKANCDPCYTEADVAQLETAILNMAVNARDAMDGEGTVSISVSAASGIPAASGTKERVGDYVAIQVTDTGEGIEADQLERVFEPFFTTKRVGQGTGLGLSQVFGFVKQSGGDVRVESKPKVGTSFTLYLPKVEEGDTKEESSSDSVPYRSGQKGCVLVVEDNAHVGEFATQLLEDLGYETVWASHAEAALALLKEGQSFDVVFTDVVMPGMSGIDLAKEVQRQRPQLPVVLASGYSHVITEEGSHGFPLLQKPYSVNSLAKALRGALEKA